LVVVVDTKCGPSTILSIAACFGWFLDTQLDGATDADDKLHARTCAQSLPAHLAEPRATAAAARAKPPPLKPIGAMGAGPGRPSPLQVNG
jgi:hypothetical protein